MAINQVSPNATPHPAAAQPAKKSNVNFSQLLNAGMAVAPQASAPAGTADGTQAVPPGKA